MQTTSISHSLTLPRPPHPLNTTHPLRHQDLRTGLNAAGFQNVKIVCGDDARTFACAPTIRTDPALAAVVYAIGSHNPGTDAAAVATGKPMWGTELEVSDPGGTDTATNYANLFLNQNITGYTYWNLLTAYYEGERY